MNHSNDGWFHSLSSKWSEKLFSLRHHHHHQKKKRSKEEILKKHTQTIEMKQVISMSPLMKCDYKILLVGSKGSGKSSLVGRFLGRPFDPRNRPTVGFNLMTLDL